MDYLQCYNKIDSSRSKSLKSIKIRYIVKSCHLIVIVIYCISVFEKDYCSGYVDSGGKWNTGFYCPPISPGDSAIYCCGTSVQKYCCNGNTSSLKPDVLEIEEVEITTDYDTTNSIIPPTPSGGIPFHEEGVKNDLDTITRNTFVAAVICGFVAVTVLMTLMACFYCKCCLLYKKRREQLTGGLYRIPASSTTCGLINSTNGPTTPGSFVTTPVNPAVFTSECWTNANPPSRPQPHQPPGPRAYVNPLNLNDHRPPLPPPNRPQNPQNIISSISASRSQIHTLGTVNSHHHQNSPYSITNTTIDSSITSQNTRLQRQISLFNQRNPMSRNQRENNSNSSIPNNHNNHNQHPVRNTAIIPTIYTPTTNQGRSTQQPSNHQHSQHLSTPQIGLGTMSSLISSVTSSSSNSLPPPYFLEQYRIRNRIRQPRNPPSVNVMLPSYNEIQRQQQQQQGTSTSTSASSGSQQSQARRPLPLLPQPQQPQYSNISIEQSPTSSGSLTRQNLLNDLSAPPKRNQRHFQRPQTLSTGGGGGSRCTTSPTSGTTISINSSPCVRQGNNFQPTSPEGYSHSAGKILNTAAAVQIQRTMSDHSRRRECDVTTTNTKVKSRQQKPDTVTAEGRISHSLENVSLDKSTTITNADEDEQINAEVAIAFRMN